MIAVSLIGGCPKSELRPYNKIEMGESKQKILQSVGNPYKIQNRIKSEKYIWGPEEEFWDKIPIGAQLEIWKYNFPEGHLNLYFVNGSEELNYQAFAPKGVVYETQ